MIQHMRQTAELIAESLGWRGKDLEELSLGAMNDAMYESGVHRRWPMEHDEDPDERRSRIDRLLSEQKRHDVIRNAYLQSKEAATAQQKAKGGEAVPNHLTPHQAETMKALGKKHRTDQLVAEGSSARPGRGRNTG
jgi:hypothetical protein